MKTAEVDWPTHKLHLVHLLPFLLLLVLCRWLSQWNLHLRISNHLVRHTNTIRTLTAVTLYCLKLAFSFFLHDAWNASADKRWESCSSVIRVHCDKTEERSVQIFIPSERSFSLVFWDEGPFYLKFWVNRPRCSEIADFEPIIACSTSAVTSSEKVQLTPTGSPLCSFR